MRRTVIVIGGGASGMMAAIHAARTGADVTILERTDRVGKKILSAGNGKCNMTNLYQSEKCYRSRSRQFPFRMIEKYPVIDTLEFFEGLGILVKNKNGYIYPDSEQASSVLDVLRMEVERLGIRVVCGCQVSEIRVENDRGFAVKTSCGVFDGERLILATGSEATPGAGPDRSGYELARSLGHTVITPLPALIQLRCQEKHYRQLAGIRTEAKLTLYVNGKETDVQTGELQLTDYSISGIPTFQLGRYAAITLYEALFEKRKVAVRIDFLPQQTVEETKTYLESRRRRMGEKTAKEWMTGLLDKKLSGVLLKLTGISLGERMANVDNRRWSALLKQIKEYETIMTTSNPYENAQICCGDVDIREVWPDTLESRLIPGLYLVGELLDVDGICGGYNLQWAWSSGALAGVDAAGGRKRYEKGPEMTPHRPQRQGKSRKRHRKNRE